MATGTVWSDAKTLVSLWEMAQRIDHIEQLIDYVLSPRC